MGLMGIKISFVVPACAMALEPANRSKGNRTPEKIKVGLSERMNFAVS
jgi:hypothetical protein